MNRFLPQLLSLHFSCYVQKLLFFVCDFPSCYSAESIYQIWLFWRNLYTFMVFFVFVCVYDVCAYVYSCSRVWESVCIHIDGTGWCQVSSSVALRFIYWGMPTRFYMGSEDLASGSPAFCNKHFNQEPSLQSHFRVCYL